jgi:NADH-quinone oxidoreductase subunit C
MVKGKFRLVMVTLKNKFVLTFIISLLRMISPLILKITTINYYLKEQSVVDFYLEINAINITKICFFFLKSSLFSFEQLINITCIDNLTKKSFIQKKGRFSLVYLLNCMNTTGRILIYFEIGLDNSLLSVSSLYNNALWLEREIFDLFGLFFFYNKDLRRLLTDYGFKGFPLRKDFPLTGYIELRYKEIIKNVLYQKVKLMQEYRVFFFKEKINDVNKEKVPYYLLKKK